MDRRLPPFHPASNLLLGLPQHQQSAPGLSGRHPPPSIANPNGSGARQPHTQRPMLFSRIPPPWEQAQPEPPRQGGPPAWLEALPPLPGLNDRMRNMDALYDVSLARPGPDDPYRRRYNPLPALVTPSSLGPSDRNCPICQTRYGEVDSSDTSEFEYPVKLQCGHIYGHQCIEEWLQTSLLCPMCKVPQDFDLGPERGESAREGMSREEWRRAEAEIQVKRRARGNSARANARPTKGEPARRSDGMDDLERRLEELQFREYIAAGFDQRDTSGDERLAQSLQEHVNTTGDERLAQTLQEHVDTTGDERLARTLQEHVDTTGDERIAQNLQAEFRVGGVSPGDSEAEARKLEEEQLREYAEDLNMLALEEWQKKEFQHGW